MSYNVKEVNNSLYRINEQCQTNECFSVLVLCYDTFLAQVVTTVRFWWVVPPPREPFFLSRNYLEWSFMWYICEHKFLSFCHNQSTRLTDRQRDGQRDRKALELPCVALHIGLQSHGKNATRKSVLQLAYFRIQWLLGHIFCTRGDQSLALIFHEVRLRKWVFLPREWHTKLKWVLSLPVVLRNGIWPGLEKQSF